MNRIVSLSRVVVLVAAAALLTGCSGPQIVPSTEKRMPTTPGEVMIYQKQPKKYELLGSVSVTKLEGAKWDDKGNADAAFEVLKKKAAEKGANGLLLKVGPAESDRQANVGYHGTFYQVPLHGTPPVGVGHAIYVLEK